MKLSVIAFVVGLFIAAPAQATLIQFDITAQNNTGDSILSAAIPNGEIVTFSMLADVQAGTPTGISLFNSASGAITWNNGGPQSMAITSGGRGTTFASGIVGIYPNNVPLVFGATTLGGFGFNVDLGVNPFSTTQQFADLLLTSPIVSFYASRTDGNSGGSIDLTILSYRVTPGSTSVPEPSAALILLFGLAGMGAVARRRRTAS